MNSHDHPYICPAEFAGSLDNGLRRLLHKPRKILEPLITEGMTVLDLGCGPGFFTSELARLVGEKGRVIAADLQQGMLDRMIMKFSGSELRKRVTPVLCTADSIGVSEKVDFVLAFWMVHEVPDQERMFREVKLILKPGGKLWIVEPKIHVTKKAFERMLDILEYEGFEITERPAAAISRSILVKVSQNPRK